MQTSQYLQNYLGYINEANDLHEITDYFVNIPITNINLYAIRWNFHELFPFQNGNAEIRRMKI